MSLNLRWPGRWAGQGGGVVPDLARIGRAALGTGFVGYENPHGLDFW